VFAPSIWREENYFKRIPSAQKMYAKKTSAWLCQDILNFIIDYES